MKRIQLVEFEDFKWFPSIWHSTMTKLIVVIHKILGTKEVITDLPVSYTHLTLPTKA